MSQLEAVTESLVEMEEKQTVDAVQGLLDAGESAQAILGSLSEGMNLVGARYSSQEYYLADLVFAAEIFKQSMVILGPALDAEAGGEQEACGKIVVGTVEGDLHDIGKNIFVALARNAGFAVNDLGIDVSPEAFIEAVKKDRAHILGLSGILTMSVGPMIRTVEALEEAGLRDTVKVILGGLPVDDRWQETVGSDGYTDDAYEGVQMCTAFMEVA
jgi:methylmalonyl-CoA mutase cobalamin-binding domain/chain